MSLIKCPECKKEISDTAVLCPNCGCNVQKMQKKQAKIEKEQKNREEWNNMTPAQKNSGIIVLAVIAVIVLFIIAKAFSNETNHKDDKCDICKKSAYSSVNGEEYCYKHYKEAIGYYLDN